MGTAESLCLNNNKGIFLVNSSNGFLYGRKLIIYWTDFFDRDYLSKNHNYNYNITFRVVTFFSRKQNKNFNTKTLAIWLLFFAQRLYLKYIIQVLSVPSEWNLCFFSEGNECKWLRSNRRINIKKENRKMVIGSLIRELRLQRIFEHTCSLSHRIWMTYLALHRPPTNILAVKIFNRKNISIWKE